MGNAKVKKYRDLSEMIDNVETAFFGSTFTHTNHNGIVKGGFLEAYNNQKKSFDESLLLECKKLSEL